MPNTTPMIQPNTNGSPTRTLAFWHALTLVLLPACPFVTEGSPELADEEAVGIHGRCGRDFGCHGVDSSSSSDEAGATESSSSDSGSNVTAEGSSGGLAGSSTDESTDSSGGLPPDPYGPCEGCWPDVITTDNGCACAPQCEDEECPAGGSCDLGNGPPGVCHLPCLGEGDECPNGGVCMHAAVSDTWEWACFWPE